MPLRILSISSPFFSHVMSCAASCALRPIVVLKSRSVNLTMASAKSLITCSRLPRVISAAYSLLKYRVYPPVSMHTSGRPNAIESKAVVTAPYFNEGFSTTSQSAIIW